MVKKFLIRLAWIYGIFLFNCFCKVIFNFEQYNDVFKGDIQHISIFVTVFLVGGLIIDVIFSLVMGIYNLVFKK